MDASRGQFADHLPDQAQLITRNKGPLERFFRTIREDLLQALPGYKGPDVHSRGLDPES